MRMLKIIIIITMSVKGQKKKEVDSGWIRNGWNSKVYILRLTKEISKREYNSGLKIQKNHSILLAEVKTSSRRNQRKNPHSNGLMDFVTRGWCKKLATTRETVAIFFSFCGKQGRRERRSKDQKRSQSPYPLLAHGREFFFGHFSNAFIT